MDNPFLIPLLVVMSFVVVIGLIGLLNEVFRQIKQSKAKEKRQRLLENIKSVVDEERLKMKGPQPAAPNRRRTGNAARTFNRGSVHKS